MGVFATHKDVVDKVIIFCPLPLSMLPIADAGLCKWFYRSCSLLVDVHAYKFCAINLVVLQCQHCLLSTPRDILYPVLTA